MKKMIPVLTAAVMAIAFSAFTTNKVTTYFYEDSPGHFAPIPAGVVPCPEGLSTQCVKNINGVPKPLWKDAGITPLKKQ